MKAKVIGILETRTGEHLSELITRRGGIALWAPALEELPDVDPKRVAALVEEWDRAPFGIVIFQTGVGTRALFAAADELEITDRLCTCLRTARVVVRGPKPVGELNARHIRIDVRAPSPFTTDTVLAALTETPLQAVRVLVQRYGAANERLKIALEARGATVEEISTYRWSLPRDIKPLQDLLGALAERRVDAVVFTSAVQIHNLYQAARDAGCESTLADNLQRTLVASIGPVCSAALLQYGIAPSLEASPPKLGPLVAALEAAF